METYNKKSFYVDDKGVHFKVRTLNTKRLREFRGEAIKKFQVWKKTDGFYVAKNIVDYNGKYYAEETTFFENNLERAKGYCERLRNEYILDCVKYYKKGKIVY